MPSYVLGNFFIYSVINAFTPGPGNILALNTVTNYGYKKGRPLYWGIFAGYYVVQVICAIFVFGVSTFLPDVLGIMKYLGAAYVGASSSAALSSGTAALHLSVVLAGVKENDVVFIPSLTFAASVNPVRYEKAVPVFIDSERDTWNMDAAALRKAFEKYPHPKAVMAVHLYGTSANMDEICALCKEHNVPLIEDAAESLGTTYKGKMTGTFGDYGIYSFNGNKIITTSGGGILVARQEKAVEKARFLSRQARDPARHYQHSTIGYNYRMSNIVAGIGCGQMQHIEEHIQ